LRLNKFRVKYDSRKYYFTSIELLMYGIVYSFVVSADFVNCFKNRLDKFWSNQDILSMIIKYIFTEPETEVKWYFDSTEEIVIVYVRNRLRGTFCLRLRLLHVYVCEALICKKSLICKNYRALISKSP